MAFEFFHADAEVLQFIAKLCTQFLDQSFIFCIDAFLLLDSHRTSDHLAHLEARDGLIPLECSIPVTFQYAICCQLGYGIICPVILRHFLERALCCLTDAGRQQHRARQYSHRKKFPFIHICSSPFTLIQYGLDFHPIGLGYFIINFTKTLHLVQRYKI